MDSWIRTLALSVVQAVDVRYYFSNACDKNYCRMGYYTM